MSFQGFNGFLWCDAPSPLCFPCLPLRLIQDMSDNGILLPRLFLRNSVHVPKLVEHCFLCCLLFFFLSLMYYWSIKNNFFLLPFFFISLKSLKVESLTSSFHHILTQVLPCNKCRYMHVGYIHGWLKQIHTYSLPCLIARLSGGITGHFFKIACLWFCEHSTSCVWLPPSVLLLNVASWWQRILLKSSGEYDAGGMVHSFKRFCFE